MGFFSTLQLILVVLKLVGVLTWSWWGVFAPLWVYIGIIVFLLLKGWMDNLC